MRSYGTYSVNEEYCGPVYYDCADNQDLLPQGARIRNKKKKRRLHNKRTRTIMKFDLRKEIEGLE